MKIPNKLIQTIAISLALTATISACSKETTIKKPNKEKVPSDPCPACGLG